mmetsp:Transcript_21366/g.39993  ORF Transcript_21366/g.39993 Transcript_21366/m.39993 type:complete len:324 (-) Transcript_21366:35-1006(-)
MYLSSVPCLAAGAGARQAARRRATSSSGTCQSITLLATSITMGSPVSTSAMGPPTAASGETCPMMNPCEPPENRPSVIRATSLPRPAPMITLVGVSISGMPGPPLGPSLRMMITSPFCTSLFSTPRSMASSWSYTRARPEKRRPSLPVILATEPSGASDPYRMLMCPDSLIARSTGSTMSCASKSSGGMPARFSATVLPVQVRQLPSRSPWSSRYFMTAGTPPMPSMSSITYLPEGFRSAMKGTLSEMVWKSSMVRSTPAALAMAIRCSTALVEPPSAIVITTAFSNAARVMMSLGLMSLAMRCLSAAPAARHSSRLSSESAG